MDRIRQAYLSVNALVSAIDRLPSDNDFGSVKLNKSIALIKARYAEPLTLEDAASACGMSKFYYSRLFKSFIGCSFKEYLNRVRIEAAKEMLQQDRFNISEACYAVGYNDLSYFSRVFKRLERQSPSDYRAGPQVPPLGDGRCHGEARRTTVDEMKPLCIEVDIAPEFLRMEIPSNGHLLYRWSININVSLNFLKPPFPISASKPRL